MSGYHRPFDRPVYGRKYLTPPLHQKINDTDDNYDDKYFRYSQTHIRDLSLVDVGYIILQKAPSV